MTTLNKVVLAYSGGLDTSAIVPWLKEHYGGCEVVCFAGDVGQGADELEGIEEKAVASGASSCHVVDLNDEFVRDYVWPTLKSGAVYEGRYLLGTSMARPVIAKAMVELAVSVGADGICHGCTGKGNDQVRFEHAVYALAPELKIIAPWRTWGFKGRTDLIRYCEAKGVPVRSTAEKIWSRDRNLWHISHEGGALEDPWNAPPDDVWMLTRHVRDTPDEPASVLIEFESGVPVKVDGAALGPAGMVERLNDIAGQHGVGRIDIVENRMVGMKSRGCYETPGGTVLMEALRALEELVLDREARRLRDDLALQFSHVVYEGRWYGNAAREAIQAAIDSLMEPVSGEVVVELFKGHATAVQRRSPNSVHDEDFASFEADEVYNQGDAEGFIRLVSLPQAIRARKQRETAQGVS
ncbi:MAG: argininosuccinate synthase [Planctomycetota bacterium]